MGAFYGLHCWILLLLRRFVGDGVNSLAGVPQTYFWELSVQVHGCVVGSYGRVVGYAASLCGTELVVAGLVTFLVEVAPGNVRAGGYQIEKWTHAWLQVQWDAPYAQLAGVRLMESHGHHAYVDRGIL